jgi:FHA domain
MPVYYSAILDALGFYVERADGSDVFVQELPPDGYLLAFLVGEEQQAVTFEAHEIESVHDEAEKHPVHTGHPSRRRHLRAVGCYLDERGASAILVQERLCVYTVDFAGQARRGEHVSNRERIHVMLTDRQLEQSEQRVPRTERTRGTPRFCPCCGALNLGGRYYCRNCAAPLAEQARPTRGGGADSAARALTLAFANGQSYRLEDNEVIVGCAALHETWHADLDVTLYGGGPGCSVARRHARLARVRSGFVVIDMGSANGTFVNGHRALRNHPVPLTDGDRLTFGALETVVSIS